ncbi:acyltransferase family protein [Leptospira stimsonii]|uniref:Acyltransferase n=1 Tax=Leptospira stimsonii TaxID=2202203 RepID=A0A8B3CK57_9LEPT|nr:acyltransferase [Leptospira stimsonii]RHX83852.1 acyltransferase [Leptospira stimsonii]
MLKSIKDIISSRESEIKPLNGLRAFAIIFVILNHYTIGFKGIVTLPAPLELLYLNLWSGVDLFFVLSGFLISKGLWENWKEDSRINFKSFYIKRTLRIFPAYYFFLTVTYLIGKAMIIAVESKGLPNETEGLKQSLANSWGDFLFLGNYIQGLNSHTWSLSSEEQFYLAFPILCATLFFKVGFKFRQVLLWLLYLIPFLFRIYTFTTLSDTATPPYFRKIYYPFQTRFDSLIIGVIVMDLYMNRQDISKFIEERVLVYYTLFIIFFSFIILTHSISQDGKEFFTHTFKYNFLNIGYAGILYLSIIRMESPLSRFLSLKVFTPIARLSYTIYLWHFILMGAAAMLLKIKSVEMSLLAFHLKFLGMGVILILLSLPLYLMIEVPFQKLRNRLRLNGTK